ncbi:hypothetical protein INT45_001705, partial [Circinella minor]
MNNLSSDIEQSIKRTPEPEPERKENETNITKEILTHISSIHEPLNETVFKLQEKVDQDISIATETKQSLSPPEEKEKPQEKPKEVPAPKVTQNTSKRNLGLKVFDLDDMLHGNYDLDLNMSRYQKICHPRLPPQHHYHQQTRRKKAKTHYQKSLKRLHISHTIALLFAKSMNPSSRKCCDKRPSMAILLAWSQVKAIYLRDYQSRPPMMQILHEIQACAGKPLRPPPKCECTASIDYTYFQPQHLNQVNTMLRRSFWEGVDVFESLLFLEFSIVALYKQVVIGCAFMTPEDYITYFAVSPGWNGAGIRQFMVYHLFQ